MLQLRSRVDAVEREWTAMQAYWKSELEHMSAQKDDAEMRFEASIRSMSEEHQLELNKRDDKITELQDQLNTSEARCEILRRDMMEKKLSSWSFTDFLNQDPNVSITSNWQRLQGLFEHFVKRTKPPSSWISNINVLAVDDPRCVPGDYMVERKKAGDDDDEDSPQKTPPKTLDLSRSGPKSKGSKIQFRLLNLDDRRRLASLQRKSLGSVSRAHSRYVPVLACRVWSMLVLELRNWSGRRKLHAGISREV
ncbi:uncharacterized protein KRP23_8400 [Phytophthora ramorum]|uniref:uncharacterized protein n=1 Tax=Phytophthora ramorum TaxID=164328 RepID=UPI0030AEF95F|nr:hypothetical protein KRP23_8400 [Phytophthora ramorum]